VFATGGRAGGVRTLLQPARAQCLRLSERFFIYFGIKCSNRQDYSRPYTEITRKKKNSSCIINIPEKQSVTCLDSHLTSAFQGFSITVDEHLNWAFTRYDRRTDWSARPRLRPTGLSDQSDWPVGQTVAEPPTSVNQINVAC